MLIPQSKMVLASPLCYNVAKCVGGCFKNSLCYFELYLRPSDGRRVRGSEVYLLSYSIGLLVNCNRTLRTSSMTFYLTLNHLNYSIEPGEQLEAEFQIPTQTNNDL